MSGHTGFGNQVRLHDNIVHLSNGFSVNVCLVSLELNGPVNINKVMSNQSVYLTTLFLGRLSPLNGYQYSSTFFLQKLRMLFLNQQKIENDHRKYFMINLHDRMLSDSAEIEHVTS